MVTLSGERSIYFVGWVHGGTWGLGVRFLDMHSVQVIFDRCSNYYNSAEVNFIINLTGISPYTYLTVYNYKD